MVPYRDYYRYLGCSPEIAAEVKCGVQPGTRIPCSTAVESSSGLAVMSFVHVFSRSIMCNLCTLITCPFIKYCATC